MKLIVLGSGTSHGVPMIGCKCEVCRSNNPKNKRTRPSIYLEDDNVSALIDTTPELRLQLVANKIDKIDAVLFTHSHADHLFGLDDIRALNHKHGKAMPLYAEKSVLEDIKRVFDYAFRPPPPGGGIPSYELNEIQDNQWINNLNILPLRVYHGTLPILAFKMGKLAYVTDAKYIHDETLEQLMGLDLLILDAVRFKPHPTHMNVDEALEVIKKVKPKRALLTHLSHHHDHNKTNAMLPDNVRLAYDGQTIEL